MQRQEHVSKDQNYIPLRWGKVVIVVILSSMENEQASAVQEARMQ